MNADPRLLILARQLGSLLRAYAEAGDQSGHLAMEVSRAVLDGFAAEPAEQTHVLLPLITNAEYRDSIALRSFPSIGAAQSLQLTVSAAHVEIQSHRDADETPRFDGNVTLNFNSERHLEVEICPAYHTAKRFLLKDE